MEYQTMKHNNYHNIYELKNDESQKQKHIRKQKVDLIISQDDLRLYNRVKFLLDGNIEPLLFKFQEFGASFSIIILSLHKNAKNIYSYLEKNKRESDFLIQIFENKNFYLLICQDTEEQGAIQFSNRLVTNITDIIYPFEKEKSEIVRISLISIEKKHIGVKALSYEVMKHFIKMKQDHKIWVQIKRF